MLTTTNRGANMMAAVPQAWWKQAPFAAMCFTALLFSSSLVLLSSLKARVTWNTATDGNLLTSGAKLIQYGGSMLKSLVKNDMMEEAFDRKRNLFCAVHDGFGLIHPSWITSHTLDSSKRHHFDQGSKSRVLRLFISGQQEVRGHTSDPVISCSEP